MAQGEDKARREELAQKYISTKLIGNTIKLTDWKTPAHKTIELIVGHWRKRRGTTQKPFPDAPAFTNLHINREAMASTRLE